MQFPPINPLCPIQRRFQAWLILCITIWFLVVSIHPIFAQPAAQPIAQTPIPPAAQAESSLSQKSSAANQVDGYPVMLNGNLLFRIKHGIPGIVTAEERAAVINERLMKVVNDDSISPETIRIEERDNISVVLANDTVLFTVRDLDREDQQSHQDIAKKNTSVVQSAMAQYRQEHSTEQIIRGMILAVLSTIALAWFLVLLQRFLSRLLIQIRAARRADALDVRIQNFQILGSDATSYLLVIVVRILRLALILGSLYLYIPFVLSQFPATKAIGNSIFNDIAQRINQLTIGFVHYLPNLAVIIIIAVVTYYVIQFAKLVITELGRDDAYPWFYPEWVQPTNRLATILLIVVGCIVAAPYLPGFNSPAFQGVSLFLGALFTLGSSSAIANAIAGVILIYTRAFRIGDIIRLGDTTGEVIEKSLFVTRILTFKREVITIPNAAVLSSNVVNFNAISRESSNHLLLHTTITLGYDIPWRTIHETLIQAATATPGILSEPSPFVLQTGLNDFNVAYELNAYSDCPELMPKVYSDLHQNIQDYCNQAGIEILSPGYSAIRDGNHSTIPSEYLPADYSTPAFQIYRSDHKPNH